MKTVFRKIQGGGGHKGSNCAESFCRRCTNTVDAFRRQKRSRTRRFSSIAILENRRDGEENADDAFDVL